jgi:hypothetical protein
MVEQLNEVWVFNSGGTFPSGVFLDRELNGDAIGSGKIEETNNDRNFD